MKGKFNTIKKSRKKSKDIDEKIEYLNKECQKTGLYEVSTTSGIYSVTGSQLNPLHAAFRNSSYDGQGLAFSGKDFTIDTTPIGGLHYSPPHPVTGERRRASSWFGIASGFGPVGENSDRQLMWYFRSDLPNGGRWVSLERTRGENPYWGTWISTSFGAETLVPYNSVSSNLPNNVKNKLDSLNINQYINPDEWKSPTNPVLFKNDLGDPGHLPINIPDLSKEAFEYLKFASNYYSPEDKKNVINYYKKKQADPSYQPKPFELESLIKQMRAQGGDGTKVASHDRPLFRSVPATGPRGDQPAHDLYKQAVQGGGATPSTGKYPLGIPLRLTHYEPEGDLLSEAIKLGYFEPEVLNVDINKLRKGIMPEFPKDPPEMIDGYSAKSRLAPKKVELPPLIKVTRKDLAQNHKLTDKEIQDFLDDIKMINDYIKKNPAELMYAMTRYPKNDTRLAQLNWQMDQKMKASEDYMETHFPENQRLFNKLQVKINQNIEMTNPKNFTGHKEAPKFTDDNSEIIEQRKKIAIKHFKKPVKIKKLFKR